MKSLSTTSDTLAMDCRDIFVEYPIHEYRARTLKETLLNQIHKKNKSEIFQALKGVSIQVKRGECVALVGPNGSGKSTTLKVMAGIIPPSRGTVVRNGTCVPQIELGAGFDPELTGRENIFLCLGLLGLTKKEIEALVPSITNFSELDAHMNMPVKTYSSGMYMRLGFACSVCVKADILLVDEILSVGDENFQRKCITKMREIRSSGSAMILVTHDLNQVEQMADRVVIFDSGSKIYDGHHKEGLNVYHELMNQKRLDALPKDIREEEIRQRELTANDAFRHFGTVVKLRAGHIENHSGEFTVISGESSRIVIEFEVIREMDENPCIGFAINSTAGLRLIGGNTNMLSDFDSVQFRSPGRYKIQLDIPMLALAAGTYRLIIAAHNHNLTKTLDINGCAHEFDVLNQANTKNFDGDILDFGTFIRKAEVTGLDPYYAT